MSSKATRASQNSGMPINACDQGRSKHLLLLDPLSPTSSSRNSIYQIFRNWALGPWVSSNWRRMSHISWPSFEIYIVINTILAPPQVWISGGCIEGLPQWVEKVNICISPWTELCESLALVMAMTDDHFRDHFAASHNLCPYQHTIPSGGCTWCSRERHSVALLASFNLNWGRNWWYWLLGEKQRHCLVSPQFWLGVKGLSAATVSHSQ